MIALGTPIANRLSYRFFRSLPGVYWRAFDRKSRRAGIDRLYLVLSFDCDTDEDVVAAEALDPWLRSRGIKSTYAVPGTQLERGADTYRRIAAQGSEFINHGYLPHTEFRDGQYRSITFYGSMSREAVEADIRRGHETVARIIGKTPMGFRAPHFGHFQAPGQLELQYRVLRELGYRYSTSTIPAFSFWRGPVWEAGGLAEFPVSGSYRMPANILDSWSHLESHVPPLLSGDYGRMMRETADALLGMRVAGVLNYYVDPAHVVDGPVFRQTLEYLLARKVEPVSYGDLLSIARPERKGK